MTAPATSVLPDRFWAKVDTSGNCWLWTGHRTAAGYGRFRYAGATRIAHRVAYEAIVGAIPDGLSLDHLCRVTSCVNPAHLEPVTHEENIRRMLAANARTHCPAGHLQQGENVGLIAGGTRRYCKPCHRARANRRRRAAGIPEFVSPTHCPQGHPYDEANTYLPPSGGRSCRACHRERGRTRQHHADFHGGACYALGDLA